MLTLEWKVESEAESTLALAESGYVDLPGPQLTEVCPRLHSLMASKYLNETTFGGFHIPFYAAVSIHHRFCGDISLLEGRSRCIKAKSHSPSPGNSLNGDF